MIPSGKQAKKLAEIADATLARTQKTNWPSHVTPANVPPMSRATRDRVERALCRVLDRRSPGAHFVMQRDLHPPLRGEVTLEAVPLGLPLLIVRHFPRTSSRSRMTIMDRDGVVRWEE